MTTILQNSQWTPPDRELAMRGQIRTGWSTLAARKPNRYTTSGYGKLTDEEIDVIQTVIKKANALERKEQIRIGLLALQYEQLCSNARGNGETTCVICDYDFGIPKSRITIQLHICQECSKAVCSRCKADYKRTLGENLVLCRLCYDSRELWKKSGGWLTNGSLPPVVMVSKEELEKIQTSLIPSAAKRARDCPSPILVQDAHNSDEEDESYLIHQLGNRTVVRTIQGGSHQADMGSLSHPPFQRNRRDMHGLSRRNVIRRKTKVREGSPGGREDRGGADGGGGGSGGGSSPKVGTLVVISQLDEDDLTPHPSQSPSNAPRIVINSPKLDSTHSSAANSVLFNAHPETAGRQNEDIVPTTPTRGSKALQHSPPPADLAVHHDNDDDGEVAQAFQRTRSRVVVRRPKGMVRTENVDVPSSSSSPVPPTVPTPKEASNVPTSPQHRSDWTTLEQLGGGGGGVGSPKSGWDSTMPLGDSTGVLKTASLPRGDGAMGDPVGGSVVTIVPTRVREEGTTPQNRAGMEDEFRKVKPLCNPANRGTTGPELSPSKEGSARPMEEGEFRKVMVGPPTTVTASSPSQQTTSASTVTASTPNQQTTTFASTVTASSPSQQTTTFASTVTASSPSQQTTTSASTVVAPDIERTSMVGEEFRKVRVVPLVSIGTALQPTEPKAQTGDDVVKVGKVDSDALLQSSPLGSAQLQDAPLQLTVSQDTNSYSSNAPVKLGGNRRRVIQSFSPSPDTIGSTGEEAKSLQLSAGSLQAEGKAKEKEMATAVVPPAAVGTSGDHKDSTSMQPQGLVGQDGEEEKSSGHDLEMGGGHQGAGDQGEPQQHNWRRRQAISRRVKPNIDDDNTELGPRPRSRVISATSDGSPAAMRRPMRPHDNPPAGDNA